MTKHDNDTEVASQADLTAAGRSDELRRVAERLDLIAAGAPLDHKLATFAGAAAKLLGFDRWALWRRRRQR